MEPLGRKWRKASKSGANGQCIEVKREADVIMVRNSNHPDRGLVACTPDEWDAFIDGAKKGEFDIA